MTTKAPSKTRNKLVTRMLRFSRRITAADCAGLQPSSEPVQYTHKHKSMKVKGGHPPRDYTAVEILIDFRLALAKQRYDDAIPLYYSLKRMLNLE